MSPEQPFQVAVVALFSAFTLLRLGFRRHGKHGAGEAVEREPWAHRAVLAGLVAAQLATLGIYLFQPEWLAFGHLPLPGAVRWAGIGAGVSGVGLMLWCHLSLGRSFHATALIKADQELVVRGPYRRVRHPMYTAFALLFAGAAVAAASAPLIGIWCGGLVLLLILRIPAEEGMLRRRFGEEYRQLERRTGRFLPRLRAGGGSGS